MDAVASAVTLCRHLGQEQFPTRPIWAYFPVSVQTRIKRNPLGAIAFAAQCVADREALYNYVEHLPVSDRIRRDLNAILILDYQINHERKEQR